MNIVQLQDLMQQSLKEYASSSGDSVFVSDLPLLDTHEKAEHHIVGVGEDLYRVNASDNHGYRLGAYHSEPHIMLEEHITASDNVTLTKVDNKLHIDVDKYTPEEPTKWYILALGGQSNMQGWGERDMPLENNPRIKQLARFNSSESDLNDMDIITKAATNYGDRFREFRPVDETNLTLIPATPCLDSAKNKFCEMKRKRKLGGMVSPGLYIAKAILPYIPEDYGIIILDVSKGSSGFGDMHTVGSYNEETMQSTLESTSWRVGNPLAREFIDRLKFVLDLNPENKLLPFIWCQGENDVDIQQHYERSKEWFLHIRDFLEESYEDRLPLQLLSNFRI